MCLKKTKHVKFSEKRTFFTPWYAHVRAHMCTYVCVSGSKNYVFRKISRALFSWNIRLEIGPFALLQTIFDQLPFGQLCPIKNEFCLMVSVCELWIEQYFFISTSYIFGIPIVQCAKKIWLLPGNYVYIF